MKILSEAYFNNHDLKNSQLQGPKKPAAEKKALSSRVEALLSSRGAQLDDLFVDVGLKEKPASEPEKPTVETRSTKQVWILKLTNESNYMHILPKMS